MKILKLALFGFLLFLLSCEKEAPRLVSPLETVEELCCINFEWLNTKGEVRLQLSENDNFSEKIIDELVVGNTYLYEKKLTPGYKYYWRLVDDSNEEIAQSSFEIYNYFEDIVGVYEVQEKLSTYPFLFDTTYDATIEITYDLDYQDYGSLIRVKNLERNSFFGALLIVNGGENNEIYCSATGDISGSTIKYNIDDRSFYAYYYKGNNGGFSYDYNWIIE